MRMSDWSSDVCSSDLGTGLRDRKPAAGEKRLQLLAIAAIGLAMDRGDGGPGLHEAPEGQPGGEQRRVRYRRAEARRYEGGEAGAGPWPGRLPRLPPPRGEIGSASGRGRVCQYGDIPDVAGDFNKKRVGNGITVTGRTTTIYATNSQ